MEEPTRHTGRNGRIDGEPMRFVTSSLDPTSGRVRITVIQRGSRAVERVQALMSRDVIELQMPESELAFRAIPEAVDVTTTGAGGGTLYRIDLTLRRESSDAGEPMPPSRVDESEGETVADPEPGIVERLTRIEAKLDRLIALYERDTTPPDA